jgi:SAM-dependent methyltransferase
MSIDRNKCIVKGLPLQKPGIEISPLFRPIVLKSESNVFYTDYTSAEESRKKHAHYEHDNIMDLDFIWTPGKLLKTCSPSNMKFDWAIASHVLEHVPNPIGWLLEVLEVLNPGGVFSLVLPDPNKCFDIFRRRTEASDLIDLWIRKQSIPSSLQIFDFLS